MYHHNQRDQRASAPTSGTPRCHHILLLPREILLLITDHLTLRDHSAFSRTCWYLAYHVQAHLFRRCSNVGHYPAMVRACLVPGSLPILERALSYGVPPSPNAAIYGDLTGLTLALVKGCSEVVATLLAKGADPNQPGHRNITPLAHALWMFRYSRRYNTEMARRVEVILHLLGAGGNPKCLVPGRVARLPIAVVLDACLDGRLSLSDTELLFRELVERGAFTDGFGDNWWSPLQWAVDRNNGPIADLLLDHGAHPDYGRHVAIWFSPIGSAIRRDNVAAIKYLISRGANPGPGPATCMSPLFYAVTVEHHDCVVALLKAGASPNVVETARSSRGIPYRTALTEAILHHREDPTNPPRAITRIVRDLLAARADVNLADISGRTPLVSTLTQPCFRPRAFFVEELLRRGANPNREFDGYTHLVWCIIGSSMHDDLIPIAKLLIQCGAADVNLCCSQHPRVTPLELVLTHIESERKWDDYHRLKDLYWKEFLRLQSAGCFQMSASVDQTLTLQNAPDDGWTRDIIPIMLKAGAQVSRAILDKFYNALF